MDDLKNINNATRDIYAATASRGKLSHFDTGMIYYRHECYEKACDCFYEGHRAGCDASTGMLSGCILDDVIEGPKLASVLITLRMEGTDAPGLLKKLAENGNSKAMFLLAYYRAKGKTFAISKEEAMEWLTKAAQAGEPHAIQLMKEIGIERPSFFRTLGNALKRTVGRLAGEIVEDQICDSVDDAFNFRDK